MWRRRLPNEAQLPWAAIEKFRLSRLFRRRGSCGAGAMRRLPSAPLGSGCWGFSWPRWMASPVTKIFSLPDSRPNTRLVQAMQLEKNPGQRSCQPGPARGPCFGAAQKKRGKSRFWIAKGCGVLTVGFKAGSSAHSRLAQLPQSLPASPCSCSLPASAGCSQATPRKHEKEEREKGIKEKKERKNRHKFHRIIPCPAVAFNVPITTPSWPKCRMWRRLARSCQAAPSPNLSPRLAGSGHFGDGPCREPQSRQLSPVSTLDHRGPVAVRRRFSAASCNLCDRQPARPLAPSH